MEWRPSGRHSFLWLHSSVFIPRCSLFRLHSSVLLRCPCAISQRSSPFLRVFHCPSSLSSIFPSPSHIYIIRYSGRLYMALRSFLVSPIVIIRCNGQLYKSLRSSLSLFQWFCWPSVLFRLFSLSFCRQATWSCCKLSVMNRLAQILRKLLMIVNMVISLPASVITACVPVVSATFVLVLTIAIVILTWQRRVIVIKKD